MANIAVINFMSAPKKPANRDGIRSCGSAASEGLSNARFKLQKRGSAALAR
jgi:hypothetical protein